MSANRASALERLRAAKAGKKSRVSQLEDEVEPDEDLFMEVGEDEYREIVRERREDQFVVDDEDGTYVETGEEWYDETTKSDVKKRKGSTRKTGALNVAPKARKIDTTAKSHRIERMLLSGRGAQVASGTKNLEALNLHAQSAAAGGGSRKGDGLVTGDAEIDALLDDLVDNPVDRSHGARPVRKPNVKKEIQSRHVRPLSTPTNFQAKKRKMTVPSPTSERYRVGEEEKQTETVSPMEVDASVKLEKPRNPVFDEENGPAHFSPSQDENSQNDEFDTPDIPSSMEDDQASQKLLMIDPISSSPHTSSRQTLATQADGSLLMYWLDATEVHDNNKVYVFGKVFSPDTKQFSSCCVVISDIMRSVFLVPRQGSSMDELKAEFEDIRRRAKIDKARSRVVKKHYAFEREDVPSGDLEVLEVQYSSKYPRLPSDLTGRTFIHIFGTNKSLLESFLLYKNLMGPDWLRITDFTTDGSQQSWCKHEVHVNGLKCISRLEGQTKKQFDVPPEPKFKLMGIHLKTVLNHKDNTNEIVLASVIIHSSVDISGDTRNPENSFQYFTLVRRFDAGEKVKFPAGFARRYASGKGRKSHIRVCGSERELLNLLLTTIQREDPDIFCGHAFVSFDLDVLLHRMNKLDIKIWSKLGRLRRSKMPKLQSGPGGMGDSTWDEKQVTEGRLTADTYLSCREFLREKTYKLRDLAQTQFGEKMVQVDLSDPQQLMHYYSSSDNVSRLVQACENDCRMSLRLFFKLSLLPLTRQLTSVCGSLWRKALTGSRAERIEYLLLHNFHNRNYIVPDRQFNAAGKKGRRKKAAYAGGLVLDPKRGFYDSMILLLDFMSLYPSIIREYNICFTTVRGWKHKIKSLEEDREKPEGEVSLLDEEDIDRDTPGVLPMIVGSLIDARRTVKQLMKREKDIVKYSQLNIRQLALKLVANSMYGCLGFTHSRFFAMPLAELITRKGRQTLRRTAEQAENDFKLEVVYGDTDSIMVNTRTKEYAKAIEIAEMVKAQVNKLAKYLEIETDGVFKTMLLLRKKKYAALMVDEKGNVKKEMKGLDLVRRDWCSLSAKMGTFVLDQILSGKEREDVITSIHTYLQTEAKRIRAMEVPIEDFAITKGLTKHPNDYPDGNKQPHVVVAKAMMAKGKRVQVGEHIPYIICKGNDNEKSSSLRAHHLEEVKNSKGELEVDIDWYMSQQIHPPIARLCDPIDGTDSAQIAHHLGLDASKFAAQKSSRGGAGGEDDSALIAVDLSASEQDLYRSVEALDVVCPHCTSLQPVLGVRRAYPEASRFPVSVASIPDLPPGPPNSGIPPLLLSCLQCSKPLSTNLLRNMIDLHVRTQVNKHYQSWCVCIDHTCRARTRMPYQKKRELRCPVESCHATMIPEFSAQDLHTQLKYLRTLFDVAHAREVITDTHRLEHIARVEKQCTLLFAAVDAHLLMCAREFFDLGDVFGYIQ